MLDLQKLEKQKQICNLIFDILKDYDDDFIEYDFKKERLAKNEMDTLIKYSIDFKSSYDFNLHYKFANYSFHCCYNTKEEFEKTTNSNYNDISECRIYFALKSPLNDNELISVIKIPATLKIIDLKIVDKKYLYRFDVFNFELNEIEKLIRYILDVYYQEKRQENDSFNL